MKNIKLRYYLRGLGIGVLVTAFILTLTGDKEVTLTDAQIKERAAELGMVDANTLVLSDLRNDETVDEPSVGKDDQGDAEDVQDAENTEGANVEQEREDAENSEAEQNPENTEDAEADRESTEETDNAGAEPEAEVTEESVVIGDTVTLTIRAGANSYSVSKELEDMGLVADAGAFDDYLCEKGYAKIVRVGTYKIVKGTSEEEIAKIITGKR